MSQKQSKLINKYIKVMGMDQTGIVNRDHLGKLHAFKDARRVKEAYAAAPARVKHDLAAVMEGTVNIKSLKRSK